MDKTRNDYQPKDGDRAHLTVQATYGDRAWHVVAAHGQTVWLPDDSDQIVRAVPEGGSVRTVAEVNAYVDGCRDAVESVIEGIVGDGRALFPRAEMVGTLRGFLADIMDSRQQMIQRATGRPGEPA